LVVKEESIQKELLLRSHGQENHFVRSSQTDDVWTGKLHTNRPGCDVYYPLWNVALRNRYKTVTRLRHPIPSLDLPSCYLPLSNNRTTTTI